MIVSDLVVWVPTCSIAVVVCVYYVSYVETKMRRGWWLVSWGGWEGGFSLEDRTISFFRLCASTWVWGSLRSSPPYGGTREWIRPRRNEGVVWRPLGQTSMDMACDVNGATTTIHPHGWHIALHRWCRPSQLPRGPISPISCRFPRIRR